MCVCVSRFLFVYANVLTYLSQKIRWKRYRLTAIILWNQLVFIAVVGYLLCASMQFINIFGSYRFWNRNLRSYGELKKLQFSSEHCRLACFSSSFGLICHFGHVNLNPVRTNQSSGFFRFLFFAFALVTVSYHHMHARTHIWRKSKVKNNKKITRNFRKPETK